MHRLGDFGIATAALAIACSTPAPLASAPAQAPQLLPRDRAETLARTAAVAIRDAMAREDFATLATYVNGRVCLEAEKGGACRWMSQAELRTCKTRETREEWQVDTGADELPRLTCLEAFRQTFFSNPGLRSAPPAFNDFTPREDNNGSSVLSSEVPGDVYVEFFADGAQIHDTWYHWQSLWLVFQSRGEKVELLAIQSHYWGI
jgi:hypothetical protein